MSQNNIPPNLDPTFALQVQKLHQLTVWGRWLFVGFLWISVGSLSLWGLRDRISLMREYFTWAALRYSLLYNLVPAFGLTLCVSMTLSVLLWQSRNICLGLPETEKRRLEQQVLKIRQQGMSHPLWKWICQPQK